MVHVQDYLQANHFVPMRIDVARQISRMNIHRVLAGEQETVKESIAALLNRDKFQVRNLRDSISQDYQ